MQLNDYLNGTLGPNTGVPVADIPPWPFDVIATGIPAIVAGIAQVVQPTYGPVWNIYMNPVTPITWPVRYQGRRINAQPFKFTTDTQGASEGTPPVAVGQTVSVTIWGDPARGATWVQSVDV